MLLQSCGEMGYRVMTPAGEHKKAGMGCFKGVQFEKMTAIGCYTAKVR